MSCRIRMNNLQERVAIPAETLVALEELGLRLTYEIMQDHAAQDRCPLASLEVVEVALVDDEESARVHREFMDVEGPTDVITFDYGELVIGAGVLGRQACEHGEPLERELLRYLIHGLLHLAGHEDLVPRERQAMEASQEMLVAKYWPEMLGGG